MTRFKNYLQIRFVPLPRSLGNILEIGDAIDMALLTELRRGHLPFNCNYHSVVAPGAFERRFRAGRSGKVLPGGTRPSTVPPVAVQLTILGSGSGGNCAYLETAE